MGLYPTAQLIYGVALRSEDYPDLYGHYEDEDYEAWKDDLDADHLAIVPVGHYDDPEPVAILTNPHIASYGADAWTPKSISSLDGLNVSDKAISKATDDCRALGLDVNFYTDASWLLVASYG